MPLPAFMKSFPSKKNITIAALLLAAGIGGYAWYAKSHAQTSPKYVFASVTRGAVIQSISGSGQVSGARQFDVKPRVSGEVVSILVKPGDAVTTETVIARLDRTDALKTVRDAEQSVRDAQLSYESQRLNYERQVAPPDASSLLQAQNAVNQAKRDLKDLLEGPELSDVASAQNDVKTQEETTKLSYDGVFSVGIRNAYDNAVAAVKNAARSVKQGVHDAQPIIETNDPNLSNLSRSKFYNAVLLFSGLPNDSSALDKVASALPSTGATSEDVDAALETAKEVLGKIVPCLQKLDDALLNTAPSASYSASSISSMKTMIAGDLSDATSRLSSVLTQAQSIDSAKTSYATALINLQKARDALTKLMEPPDADKVAAAEEKVAQAQASLEELQNGISDIDRALAENALKQRQASLVAAQSKLADVRSALGDYDVKAPFAGTVAAVSADVADEASPSTVIATVVTTAKIAELSLNEVDAAKIEVGQKAIVTFDAIPGLSVAGVVSEVDSIGAASQGVVTYPIKIVFETQDERVKSGMSATAQIILSAKTDVLTLPNAAIHMTDGNATVSILADADVLSRTAFTTGIESDVLPTARTVEVGVANDQYTEIVSGLNESDVVVLRTVSGSSGSSALLQSSRSSSSGSAVRIPGLSGPPMGR